MRVSGVPFDIAKHHGFISPICGVLHRTYGGWAGDYSVGKYTPNGVGFHFLIGKSEGQWVQFCDTTSKCWHAGGWPNGLGVGLEFTGRNGEPLTDWQVRAGAWVIAAVSNAHSIPYRYYHGPRIGTFRGWLTHASVYGSDHTDMVTLADWDRMGRYWSSTPQTPPPPPNQVDWAAVRRLAAAKTLESLRQLPNLGGGDNGLHVVVLQQALNIVSGAKLKEDGFYSDATITAVLNFQNFMNKLKAGTITDFPGAAHETTRFWLAVALDNIVKGKA